MRVLHNLDEIIGDRYKIIATLGEGGMGTTYAAIDLGNSQQVALKVVSLRQAGDWKVLDLFEREAKVLASLSHEFIPQYLDYLELETADDKRFYLVQELVEGKSLAELVASGWHATEAEVQDIAIQLLEILSYLHSLTPPVIHRDIKPQNIIRREDGKVYLVDFGAVQDIYRNTVSLGKTFVGTLGYMSLEQLRGNVTPASDLFSLGGTLLFLLTHRSPTDLPQKGMKIDFGHRVNVAHDFKAWLEKILEPIVEVRFQSAEDALKALRNKSSVSRHITKVFNRPLGSKIILKRQPQSLEFKIPIGWHYPHQILTPGFQAIAMGILGLMLLPEITVGVLFASFFYVLFAPNQSGNKKPQISPAYSTERYIALEINPQTFRLENTSGVNWLGKVKKDWQEGNTADILWVNTLGGEGTKDQVLIATKSQLYKKQRQYVFGSGQINKQEARWMAREISAFIDKMNAE